MAHILVMLLVIGCLTAIIEAVPQSTLFGYDYFLSNNSTWDRERVDGLVQNGSCIFGSEVIPNGGDFNACLGFTCQSGIWNYNQTSPNACGICQVDGDPHVHTWTPKSPSNVSYELDLTDRFIIAQPGRGNNPLYGVKGRFGPCTDSQGMAKTCITSITYHEPGIEIRLVIESESKWCTASDLMTAMTDPDCQIKVLANYEEISVGTTVKPLFGLEGAILVFKSAGITRTEDLNCISLVGTNGLSMSLCAVQDNFPYLYIWAIPSLKTTPSTLYGLCNTFTVNGVGQDTLVFRHAVRGHDKVPANLCEDIKSGEETLCNQFAESWKLFIR